MIRPKLVMFLGGLFVLSVLSAAAQVAPQPAETPAEGETLHVLVGKSVVVNVQSPLTRVLSSNPIVVETMATSPTQIVVQGKAAGSSSLILWDAANHTQILDVVVDVDVASLRTAIQHAYPKDHLDVEADGGRLLLTGTAANSHVVDDLAKMAGNYSTQVVNSVQVPIVHERQVMLEVRFVEVDRTALSQFGVNLLSTGLGKTLGRTTTGQYGGFGPQTLTDVDVFGHPVKGVTSSEALNQVLNIFLFRPDIHLGAVIQALEGRNVLQILASPNLMATSGQKATFLAGGEFPFPIVQPSGGGTTVTIQFKPFGVKLDFTGFVQDDNTLRLHVAPEVSALDFSNALTLSGFTIPAISTRRAETEIELKDGQSFGIAGLMDRRATTQLSKVPGIGDIPVLGQLFRSRSINKTNTELLVFVTPHIVDPIRAEAAVPATPKPSVPFLDQKKFDEQAPGNKKLEGSPEGSGAK